MARVLLLFGGRSAEHDVSCVSAVAVTDALLGAGHQVIPVGIDREGAWWLADIDNDPMVAAGRPADLLVPSGTILSGSDRIGFDVVFPVLHGPFGEDGTIQGALEMADIPYVGCHVKSSAVAMDKDLTKKLLVQAGVPTARWHVVRRGEFNDPGRLVDLIVGDLGLPVFVKPAELGSSVGVTRCTTEHEIKEGIVAALEFGEKVIVEEAVVGREIEVAVLDGPRVSRPGEIVLTERGWYDYEAKYQDPTSEFVAPAALSAGRTAEVRALAAQAFETLECTGLARIDFFFEAAGRGFLLNEINTMPGFTPISGFPKMWMATGMSYPDLCNELVETALR